MSTNKLFNVNVIVTEKNNLPAIMLRNVTSDEELIKQIITAAHHEQPLIIMPRFTNKVASLSSLVEKGILYKDIPSNTYRFPFE